MKERIRMLMVIPSIYLLISVAISAAPMLKMQWIMFLCIVGASVLAVMGGGGLRRGITMGNMGQKLSYFLSAIALVAFALWLSPHFSVHLPMYTFSGRLWVLIGVATGLLI